jgi:hypothetical protein
MRSEVEGQKAAQLRSREPSSERETERNNTKKLGMHKPSICLIRYPRSPNWRQGSYGETRRGGITVPSEQRQTQGNVKSNRKEAETYESCRIHKDNTVVARSQ